jgi:F-type H+-transporting ATPase subunit a
MNLSYPGIVFKRLSFVFLLTFSLFLAPALNARASESEAGEAFDPGSMIKHHVGDAHEWHLWDGKFGTLYLPVILYSKDKGLEIFSSSRFYNDEHASVEYAGYKNDHGHITPVEEGRGVVDLSITKNVASMFLSVIIMFAVFFSVAGAYKKRGVRAPKGLQSFLEPIIMFIREDIAKPNIGPKYEKYLPYLLTIFFFIWINNLLGLLPGGANLTGNIAVTLMLALFTLLITLFSANKSYWAHIFNTPGVPMWLAPIMIPVELLGILTKPFSLMVRLFANITAGHIIILSLFSLIFIFRSIAVGPISVAFATFMNFLELFVALLQAYIFTLLSAMYFGSAVEDHGHDDVADIQH